MFKTLIEKYNLAQNTYENLPVISNEEYSVWITDFCGKWSSRFAQGYWNFDLMPLPWIWHAAIDEALDIITEDSPEFKICQIKIKFGGVRFYLIDISGEVFDGIEELESVLQDDSYIY